MPIDAAAAIAKDLRLECPKPCIPGAISLVPSDYHNMRVIKAREIAEKKIFRHARLNTHKKIEEAVAERDAAGKVAEPALRKNLRIENYARDKYLPVKPFDYNGFQMISYLRNAPDQSDLVREAALEDVANLYEICRRLPLPTAANHRSIASEIISKKCVYTAPLFCRLVTQEQELPDTAIGSPSSYEQAKAALQPLIDSIKTTGRGNKIKKGIDESPASALSPTQPLDVPGTSQPEAPGSARSSFHIDMQPVPRSTGESITRPLLRLPR